MLQELFGYVGLAFAASLRTSRNKRRIRWESIVGGNRRAPALALQGFAKGELDFIQLASQPRRVVPFWRSKREGDAGGQHRRRLISSPITWSRMKQIHRRFPEHPCQFNYPLIPIRWHLVWINADTIAARFTLSCSRQVPHMRVFSPSALTAVYQLAGSYSF